MARRIVVGAVAAAMLATAPVAAAKSWPALRFHPAVAEPGARVVVSISLTPAHYVAPPRPGGALVEIVLVPAGSAATVGSKGEPGVVRVATVHADLDRRGRASFRLPDLPAGRYAGAYAIGDTFHAPYASSPLDNHGFTLLVEGGESRESLMGPLLVLLALGGVIVALRRRAFAARLRATRLD